MKYTAEQIEMLLQAIYDGDITPDNLPEDLYYAIADYLKEALYKGYGGTLAEFTGPDQVLLNELRENVYIFSGAKVFQQINDLSLVRDDDTIKSFAEFREEALKIYNQYNVNWLETERSTAIGQAQNAVRWSQVEQQKHVLPLLRYSDVEDDNECEICAPLGGIVLPVDDPFWDENMPLNHFNCRCTVEQLGEGDADTTPASEVEEKLSKADEEMQPLFKMNPGKDGYLFSPEHPYFEVSKGYRAFAEENFGLPIPPALEMKKTFTDPEQLKENVKKLLDGPEKFDTQEMFKKEGSKEYTADRLDFHHKITEEYVADGSTNLGTSYFMGGAPATGKSSIIESGAVKLPEKILVVDSDVIKGMLPEYNVMLKERSEFAASKVHEESSLISKNIVATAAEAKFDIVNDGVGDGKYDSIVEKVLQQRAAGKRVEAYYVTTNVETSVSRAALRGVKSGRNVPEKYIRDMHREISNLVPDLAKNNIFDVLKLYDNNGAAGSKPILIFEQKGKKIIVHDAKRYKDFLKQGSKAAT